MLIIHLTKKSHDEPFRFRIKYNDAQRCWGPMRRFLKISPSYHLAEIWSGYYWRWFSSIAVSITCLKKLKAEDFVVLDKHANFGGTCWANTYHGCASDITAVWYSLFDELTNNWAGFNHLSLKGKSKFWRW